MAYTLPALGYAYDALEPHIDAKTMEIHYTKHHQTYIDKLNAALEGTEQESLSLDELLQSIDILPSNIKDVVKNNGGGHWNHTFFRQSITPGGKQPSAALSATIKEAFGSRDECKKQFIARGLGVFGSGRVWLIKKYDTIELFTTPNQNNPLMVGEKAILGIDLWEHAYYLNYQNRRAEYLEHVREIIDREKVEQRLTSKR